MAATRQQSEEPLPIPSGRVYRARLRVPPSKSVTNRYLNLVLLAGREAVLESPLAAADTERFAAALARLGWAVDDRGDAWRLTPPARPPAAARLDCGASGTMARFLVATLAALPGTWHLDGGERLRERPLGPLAEALETLGAGLAWGGHPGHLPVAIAGGRLAGGAVRLDAGDSSQFLSALLMAATRAAGAVTIDTLALTSAPYVALTLDAVAACGGRVERRGDAGFQVSPGLAGRPRLRVPGDESAACYPAAAAALTGGRAELAGLERETAQGDRRFIELLGTMGAAVAWRAGRLEVSGGGRLAAVDADLSAMPDQVPTLAALAPFAEGVTRIRGVPHLRLKESDRLAAAVAGLSRAGAVVEELEDGLRIPGIWATAPPPATEVVLDPRDDHRMAMSFALVGLRRPGLAVATPGVVAKSYPGFWRHLFAGLED